ncbi:glycoside hydrolase family 10 protein [Persicirhabdus sediminis]|uniref:Family 10 glycosylhydrolase n=1 Tax=Persicirhabdus sediminis TaxID=454144 RepID=A0A8J7SI52_9BACT|nr:family 10 glycosylhydrolase [Persicirhabdus sediminis]MBK1790304.1 family 10 glycosylhydrolase [Persicirhabdus sediminis]
MTPRIFILILALMTSAIGQTYKPSREKAPLMPKEFRAAWVATVHNIDWPSKAGLSASAQQAEMRRILDKMAAMKMNAIILQVRPNADALYRSRLEPWSQWLTGTMGKDPGYDPLAYAIQQAHARGIEVHAWFNPFRALCNVSHRASSNHITKTSPSLTKRYKQYVWLDPSKSAVRKRALDVIADVVRRYDIDGVHIDDYFYPYPDVKNGQVTRPFPDGLSPAKRRGYVDNYVKDMYRTVKGIKPWVRVGISPFGIWKPGVPAGIEAGIDAHEHLSADSRKWLASSWCDYLAPQLYWRIQPKKQSYTLLLDWWRKQGKRPVWPGIATSRINSTADPGRPASEIVNQVSYSRSIGRNYVGHIHWSVKALMENRGGISSQLSKNMYTTPALVPPMPWLSKKKVDAPSISAKGSGGNVSLSWRSVKGAAKYGVQARYNGKWVAIKVVPAGTNKLTIKGSPELIAIVGVDRYGTEGDQAVVQR